MESSLNKATQAEEAGRKLLYTTDMRLAPFYWRDDRTSAQKLRSLLARHIPSSKLTASKDAPPTAQSPISAASSGTTTSTCWTIAPRFFRGMLSRSLDGAFTANGQLVTLDQSGQVRRWQLGSQVEDQAIRRDLDRRPGLRSRSPRRPTDGLPRWPKGTRFTFMTPQPAKRPSSSIPRVGQGRSLIFTPDGRRSRDHRQQDPVV